MINLSGISEKDIQILTKGKLNNYLGIRDPLKMHRISKEQRLQKLKNIPAIFFLFKKK